MLKVHNYQRQMLYPCVSGKLGAAAMDSLVPADELSRRRSGADSFQQPVRLTEQDHVLSYQHQRCPHSHALKLPPVPKLPASQSISAQPPSLTTAAPAAQCPGCYPPLSRPQRPQP